MSDSSPSPARRSMLGFYIGTGVVCLMLLGAYCAWTPLRIWRLERAARRGPEPLRCSPAFHELVRLGPQAYPAVKRAYDAANTSGKREVLEVLWLHSSAKWSLPLFIETACAEEDITQDRFELVSDAVAGGLHLAGLSGSEWKKTETLVSQLRRNRKTLLDWWEAEGKVKHGAPTTVNGER